MPIELARERASEYVRLAMRVARRASVHRCKGAGSLTRSARCARRRDGSLYSAHLSSEHRQPLASSLDLISGSLLRIVP